MDKSKKYLSVTICLLTALLTSSLGIIGNLLSNIIDPIYTIDTLGPFPPITEFILPLFELNNNNFSQALFLFVILYIFLAILILLSEKTYLLFWHIFLIISLLLGLFLSIIAIGLLQPYMILMIELNDDTSSFMQIINFVNLGLVFVLTFLTLLLGLNKIKTSKA